MGRPLSFHVLRDVTLLNKLDPFLSIRRVSMGYIRYKGYNSRAGLFLDPSADLELGFGDFPVAVFVDLRHNFA